MEKLMPLAAAWEAINSLGGRSEQNNSYDQGFVDAVAKALEEIEKLGGDIPMKTDVTFTYKNHRGETSVRLVRPITVSFGATGFHPEPQWLLHGWDLNKDAERTFAMKDIKDWEPASPTER